MMVSMVPVIAMIAGVRRTAPAGLIAGAATRIAFTGLVMPRGATRAREAAVVMPVVALATGTSATARVSTASVSVAAGVRVAAATTGS